MQPLAIRLKQAGLQLDEVTVVAQRKDDVATTAYSIDRTTLDNQQMLNLGDAGYPFGIVCLVIAIVWFCLWYRKETKKNNN
jgi:hypothetical protein